MSEGRPARVGIRELRQNLSVYVDRVKDGETLEVTEHGHPVAQLRPLARSVSVYDRLVEEGRITPPSKPGPMPPPIEPSAGSGTLTEIVLEMRDEDDR